MTSETPFVRTRLVDRVIDHLRSQIASGDLATGAKLPPEGKLTQQLGVSRTTLREAMVVLAHDGLVDVRHGDGTYVRERKRTELDLANRPVAELLELKRALHLELARLAATRCTDRQASTLLTLASQLADALAAKAPASFDLAATMESAISDAAHSPLLQSMGVEVAAAIQAAKNGARTLEDWSTTLQYLVESARGIANRDVESADRHTRLWLASQATLLEPDRPHAEYDPREPRRGPRAKHTRRPDDHNSR